MIGPFLPDVMLNVPDRLHDTARGDVAGKGCCRGKGCSAFERLLSGALNADPQGAGTVSETPAPDRRALQHIAEIVQLRMSSSLLETQAEEDRPTPITDRMVWQSLYGKAGTAASTPSNIQHCFQKSNALRTDERMDSAISQASRAYGVDDDLIRSVIRAESNFNAACTSPKGAMGLMQIMPETAQELGVRDPYNPVENIMGGTRYLRKLLDRYDGNVTLCLAAYNWGMGNLERHPENMPQETRTYIARVQGFMNKAAL